MLNPGQSVDLNVLGLDRRGLPVDEVLDIEWSLPTAWSSYPVLNGSWTAPDTIGGLWLIARYKDETDRVAVWIQHPEQRPSSFKITLHFASDVPDFWRSLLESAARRWEEVIRSELPPIALESLSSVPSVCDLNQNEFPDLLRGQETGIRIAVDVSHNFAPGTYVEAVGGSCIHRGLPHPTTAVGIISLNADRFQSGSITSSRFKYVAQHEMGHTFGLVGGVQGVQPVWIHAPTHTYTGLFGLLGQEMDSGQYESTIHFTPGHHWQGSGLMGSTPSLFITFKTRGALMDLGYPAAWYAGDYPN